MSAKTERGRKATDDETIVMVRERLLSGYGRSGKGYLRYARAANDVHALLEIITRKEGQIDYLLTALGEVLKPKSAPVAPLESSWEGDPDA